ncbi:MAG: thioredoxin family protein [Maribacter sp.]|nr:thioredoxin family protein [Maribacter sp.]
MMKFLSLLIVATFLVSCKQNTYTEVVDKEGELILLGKINLQALQKEPYNEWFRSNYDSYQPDTVVLGQFNQQLKEHRIQLFLGTWCSDSQREVPNFIKILQVADFPMNNLEMVAMDRDKENPAEEKKTWNIDYVPTFIFVKDGKEVNRIVEMPLENLEKDMLKILTGQPYTPNYAE